MRRRFTLSLLLAFCLAACRGPAFGDHPRPALAVDAVAWEPFLAECAPDASGRHGCPPLGRAGALGCDVLALPDDLLGGLDPAWPLARCEIHPVLHDDDLQGIMQTLQESGDYLYRGGGFWPVFPRYLIQDGAGLNLLKGPADLQEAFASIESVEEALSYALAATGLDAYYGLERERGLAYAVDTLEDTHVAETGAGYTVLLYRYQVFGCGPHWTSAVEVAVHRDGSWSQARTRDVYHDPEEDGLCVD